MSIIAALGDGIFVAGGLIFFIFAVQIFILRE